MFCQLPTIVGSFDEQHVCVYKHPSIACSICNDVLVRNVVLKAHPVEPYVPEPLLGLLCIVYMHQWITNTFHPHSKTH